jgi:hypothetical protein
MKGKLLLFCGLVYLLLDQMTSLTGWEPAAVTLFIYFFLSFLMDLGKKVVILDLTLIMMSLTCLLMPVVFYHVYTKSNPLARIWIKYMLIPSDDYFSFAVPATIALWLGIKLPLGGDAVNRHPERYIQNVKNYLSTRPSLGMILIGVGFVSGMLVNLVPANLLQVFYLLAHLTHAGVFYTIYAPHKHKRIAVPAVILLVITQSIAAGMFGELVFMTACSLVLILLGKKITFRRKLAFAIAGLFLIVLLQSIKKDYRQRIWNEEGSGDPVYFAELVADRITNPSVMLEPNMMFYAAVRMNQGWLVATTMYKVPRSYPFAYGQTIWTSIAAAIAPRFLWPDKPETGGKANLKRFWGFDLVGFSTNIGVMGEAYANFDRVGGIIYMFLYGLFFNFVLWLILKKSVKTPTLALWIPFLFFNAIAVETDLLSTMGALVKAAIMTWLVYFLFRKVFHINL